MILGQTHHAVCLLFLVILTLLPTYLIIICNNGLFSQQQTYAGQEKRKSLSLQKIHPSRSISQERVLGIALKRLVTHRR